MDLSKLACNEKILSGVTLSKIAPFNIFSLHLNFNKSTVRLYFILILSMLTNYEENQISITMFSIKC